MLYGSDWITFQLISEIFIQIIFFCNSVFVFRSHKKRKVSLESSLVRLLFAAEFEFPKILVRRLPQNTSNGNIESTGKSKQLYIYVTNFLGP